MKLLLIFVSITLMAFTCRKSGEPVYSNDDLLSGTWRNISSWHNPGSGPVTVDAPSDKLFIDFRAKGAFSSNLGGFEFDSYKIDNDQRVTFSNSSNGSKYTAAISLIADTLRLARVNCIEGCGHTFVRHR